MERKKEKNISGIDESEPVRINKKELKSKMSAKRGDFLDNENILQVFPVC